jgi:hypothetical protein
MKLGLQNYAIIVPLVYKYVTLHKITQFCSK